MCVCVCVCEGTKLEECHSAGTAFVRALKRAEWALTQLCDSPSVLPSPCSILYPLDHFSPASSGGSWDLGWQLRMTHPAELEGRGHSPLSYTPHHHPASPGVPMQAQTPCVCYSCSTSSPHRGSTHPPIHIPAPIPSFPWSLFLVVPCPSCGHLSSAYREACKPLWIACHSVFCISQLPSLQNSFTSLFSFDSLRP